jgi:hypothetical protein
MPGQQGAVGASDDPHQGADRQREAGRRRKAGRQKQGGQRGAEHGAKAEEAVAGGEDRSAESAADQRDVSRP